MAKPLTKKAISAISSAIETLFDRVKVRFLGPQYVKPKKIEFKVKTNPVLNLPGLFKLSAVHEGAQADEDRLHSLVHIAETYLDAHKERTKAKVVQAVDSFLQDAQEKGVDTDWETVLGGQLADTWKEVSNNVKRIVTTEATTAQNMGALEAIGKINAAAGIDDPVVYWVCHFVNGYPCPECRRLHLMEDEVTPRLWYRSECKNSYATKGDEAPSLLGQHPNCACKICTLMPGYGHKEGKLEYIGPDHDAILVQRGVKSGQEEVA